MVIYKSLFCSGQDEVIDEAHDEEDSDYCLSEESYHSLYSSDTEAELSNYEGESYGYCKKNPIMEVNSKFPNVIAFTRALNHHALINEFEYSIEKSELTPFSARCISRDCELQIHASVLQDVTFELSILCIKGSVINTLFFFLIYYLHEHDMLFYVTKVFFCLLLFHLNRLEDWYRNIHVFEATNVVISLPLKDGLLMLLLTSYNPMGMSLLRSSESG